jgi:hypothetical protein
MQYQQPRPGQPPYGQPPPGQPPSGPPGQPPPGQPPPGQPPSGPQGQSPPGQPPPQPPQPEPAHRRRSWEAAWWAGAFIWAGLVLLADNVDALPDVEGASTWSWILAGAGLLALAFNVWRTVSAREPNPDAGDFFWTGVLLVLGFAGFFGSDLAFPVILIVLGGVLLLRAVVAQRRATGN